MIDPALAPGAIKTGMLALRIAIQQERDVAAIALRADAAKPTFDGKGPSAPHVGNLLDIDA